MHEWKAPYVKYNYPALNKKNWLVMSDLIPSCLAKVTSALSIFADQDPEEDLGHPDVFVH